jgi:hypothetical protein
MAAQFPNSVKTFVNKADLQDYVIANDVNQVYDEVTSIQSTLGTLPQVSGVWGSGSFTSGTTNWSSTKARIQNIENGVYSLVQTSVSNTGGSTITPSSSSTVGLTIKAASGQTANLVEFKNAAGTVVAYVTAAGAFVGLVDGGTA